MGLVPLMASIIQEERGDLCRRLTL
jgi:hypothetical protein